MVIIFASVLVCVCVKLNIVHASQETINLCIELSCVKLYFASYLARNLGVRFSLMCL